MKNLKILAAVVTVALGGCVHEGDPHHHPPSWASGSHRTPPTTPNSS